MSYDSQIWEGDVTVRLTAEGKLPRTIQCPFCGGKMYRALFRRKPTYRCVSVCEATTTLDLSPEQKARGLK